MQSDDRVARGATRGQRGMESVAIAQIEDSEGSSRVATDREMKQGVHLGPADALQQFLYNNSKLDIELTNKKGTRRK